MCFSSETPETSLEIKNLEKYNFQQSTTVDGHNLSLLLTYSLTLIWMSHIVDDLKHLSNRREKDHNRHFCSQMNNSRDRAKARHFYRPAPSSSSSSLAIHEVGICMKRKSYTISIIPFTQTRGEQCLSRESEHGQNKFFIHENRPILADDRTIKRWMSLICQCFDDQLLLLESSEQVDKLSSHDADLCRNYVHGAIIVDVEEIRLKLD